MNIIQAEQTMTAKHAHIAGATSEDEALDFALAYFGESLRRLHYWNVTDYGDDRMVVSLFTN